MNDYVWDWRDWLDRGFDRKQPTRHRTSEWGDDEQMAIIFGVEIDPDLEVIGPDQPRKQRCPGSLTQMREANNDSCCPVCGAYGIVKYAGSGGMHVLGKWISTRYYIGPHPTAG